MSDHAHPLSRRYRDMTEEEYTQLVEDIGANGLHEPIVMFEGMILDGRHRYRALHDLHERGVVAGVPEPPFVHFEGTYEEAEAYVRSLNVCRRHLTQTQIACQAVEQSRILTVNNPTQAETAVRFGVTQPLISRVEDVRDEAPDLFEVMKDGGMQLRDAEKEIRERKATARRDSLMEAGESPATPCGIEVIEADCAEYLQTRPQEFDCMIADPPYNTGRMEWDERMDEGEYLEFMKRWLVPAFGALKPLHNAFIFCPSEYGADVEYLLRRLGRQPRSRIVWHHRNISMGRVVTSGLARTYDLIFHCGTAPLNFPEQWDDRRFDVQTTAAPQTNFGDEKIHQAQKPLELVRWMVEIGSARGGMVLDPFGGSGTTGMACLSIGRGCVLIEQSAEFCRLMRGRLSEWP